MNISTHKQRRKSVQEAGRILKLPPSDRRVINRRVQTTDIYLSGLLARRQKAWSQDGGNMRVIANRVTR